MSTHANNIDSRVSIWRRLTQLLPPRPTSPPSHLPAIPVLYGIAGLIAVALSWHFTIAHPAIASFAWLPLIIKGFLLSKNRHTPPRWIILTLTITSIALILIFYGGWNGQTAGISFVSLLVSLKFLESRNLRDYLMVCIILYFLTASAFLFDSSIVSIILVGVYVIGITCAMQLIVDPFSNSLNTSLRSSVRFLLTALPLALLLFFFFPRIQGDFGFLPSQDERESRSGLEDSLVAGELAAAAFDRSLAFRAEFNGNVPPPQDRYWRVKVLTGERNFQWEIAPDKIMQTDAVPTVANDSLVASGDYNYEILHEESTDRYLPYLDYINSFSDGVLLENSVVKIPQSRTVMSYRGAAKKARTFSTPPPTLTTDIENHPYLNVVAQPSRRMQQQLLEWQKGTNSNVEVAQRILNHFATESFSYSLLPPNLDETQPLEDFLFNTRIGYCEHYASAFTTIMRWMNIPARVVVGYQGGEFNSAGSFLQVRYSDAHAWSEIWVNDQWLRIDPTAAVSPERIELGMDALFQLWDGREFSQQRRGRALADYLNPRGVGALLRGLQESAANIGYQWNKWVVNYDRAAQQELLAQLGLVGTRTVSTLILLIVAGVGALGLIQWLSYWRSTRVVQAREVSLMQKLQRRLDSIGIHADTTTTARELLNNTRALDPHLATQLSPIVLSFEQLRYHPLSNSERRQYLKQLRSQLNEFFRSLKIYRNKNHSKT